MVRHRMTIKRIDPWSVLKFGAVANLALLAIFMLVMGVVWFIIDRLELVDQACSIATDVGFTTCGINVGNLFRALLLLGLLWIVIQTAVLVFFAFLHNLIADLTGGLVIGVVDDAPSRPEANRRIVTASSVPANDDPPGDVPPTGGPVARDPGPARTSQQPQVTRRGRSSPSGFDDDELFGSR